MTASQEQDFGLWSEQMADLLASSRFSEWILRIQSKRYGICRNGSAIADCLGCIRRLPILLKKQNQQSARHALTLSLNWCALIIIKCLVSLTTIRIHLSIVLRTTGTAPSNLLSGNIGKYTTSCPNNNIRANFYPRSQKTIGRDPCTITNEDGSGF